MTIATKTANFECSLLKGKDNTKKRLVKFWVEGTPKERMMTEAEDFCLNHCPFHECLEDVHDRKERPKLTRAEYGKLTFARRGRVGMRELGRKGGLATARKYGHDKLAEWGRKGGRASALTLKDIGQQQPLNEKEVMDTPGNDLKELKRLYRLRQRSNGHKQIQEGLGVTPSH